MTKLSHFHVDLSRSISVVRMMIKSHDIWFVNVLRTSVEFSSWLFSQKKNLFFHDPYFVGIFFKYIDGLFVRTWEAVTRCRIYDLNLWSFGRGFVPPCGLFFFLLDNGKWIYQFGKLYSRIKRENISRKPSCQKLTRQLYHVSHFLVISFEIYSFRIFDFYAFEKRA